MRLAAFTLLFSLGSPTRARKLQGVPRPAQNVPIHTLVIIHLSLAVLTASPRVCVERSSSMPYCCTHETAHFGSKGLRSSSALGMLGEFGCWLVTSCMARKYVWVTCLQSRNVKQNRKIVDDVYIYVSYLKVSDIAYLRWDNWDVHHARLS